MLHFSKSKTMTLEEIIWVFNNWKYSIRIVGCVLKGRRLNKKIRVLQIDMILALLRGADVKTMEKLYERRQEIKNEMDKINEVFVSTKQAYQEHQKKAPFLNEIL